MPTRVGGDALHRARSARGLTHSQLAQIIDVSGGERVSECERGVRTPAVRLIPEVAAALGVTPLEFLALPNGVDLILLVSFQIQAATAERSSQAGVCGCGSSWTRLRRSIRRRRRAGSPIPRPAVGGLLWRPEQNRLACRSVRWRGQSSRGPTVASTTGSSVTETSTEISGTRNSA